MSDITSTTLINQMVSTCSMAIGILKTGIKYSFEPDQAQIAEIIVRTLESQVKAAKRLIEQAGEIDEELVPYRDHAVRAVEDVDWIVIPRHSRTIPADGGAYVEALIHVSADDLELTEDKE